MHFLFPWVSCTNQRDTVQASSVGLLDYLVPGFWQGLNNIRISDLNLKISKSFIPSLEKQHLWFFYLLDVGI